MHTPRASSLTPYKLILFACLLAAGAHGRVVAQGAQPQQQATAVSAAARGIELYRRGDNEAALKSLREATKKEKTDPEAWHYFGLALANKSKYKDARKAFERALELRPNFPAALTSLAYTLLRLGETYEAANAAERAVKLEPSFHEARYILGITHLRQNSNTRALDEAEAALKLNPAFAPALYVKVLALVGMSANAVSAATDETPDVRKVLFDKVGARLDEAEAALGRLAQLDPKHSDIELLTEQPKTLRLYGRAFAVAPGAPSAVGDILTTRDVSTKAQIISKPEPLYTEKARKNQITGTVTLRMVLAADGAVRHIFVMRGLPDGLTQNAINAARKIKFVPATKDGRPVSQFATIQYNFNIY